ncbi:heme/hemin ABC transporter substrate-binding protein [Falsiroseomonas ponticola]|uniref:heme/hemin ABC transporter substrate-binding protein n=1 Tax=Falsiroseomonas ponticola TaxID=2786951 RepID=UPI001933CA9F|nr:ABC transporter substrate-binding protein [Roseomonas ponticola]
MIARRLLLAGAAAGLAAHPAAAMPARLVSVGGGVTETVFALGAGSRVIAVDSTSRFPLAAAGLPQVGYLRSLAPEGLIGLSPDLLLISGDAGPPQALAVLRAAGAPVTIVPEEASLAGVTRKIASIAGALGVDGTALSRGLEADWRALDAPIAALARPRALFVLSTARGAPLVSGRDTHAHAMLRAAGATNVIDSFAGYRPLSAEMAAALAPDVIVMMDHALAEAGGPEALFRIPALAVTPAAAARRAVAMDGAYMLNFGPRAAHARHDLAKLLHPAASLPAPPPRPWA